MLIRLHAARGKAAPQASAALLRHKSIRSAVDVQRRHSWVAAAEGVCIRLVARQEASYDDCKAKRVLRRPLLGTLQLLLLLGRLPSRLLLRLLLRCLLHILSRRCRCRCRGRWLPVGRPLPILLRQLRMRQKERCCGGALGEAQQAVDGRMLLQRSSDGCLGGGPA